MLLRRGLRQAIRRTASLEHASLRLPRNVRYNATGQAASSGPRLLATLAAAAVVGGVGGFLVAELAAGSGPTPAQKNYDKPQYGGPKEVQAAKDELRQLFPSKNGKDRVADDKTTLETYGYSHNSYHPEHPHSMVVRVFSTEDVVKVVNIARKYRIPVTAYSGGTSLEGHFSGYQGSPGGICIDLSGMNKILEIHEGDSDIVVQSGVKWEDLNAALAEKNIPLFFPLDPGPGATIGGMIATGCSGTNAVRYGTAKAEWFLNVTVVLPNGEVIKTRRRARKSSAGFDTTKLFIGAEGTLGIVTEATLRLTPKLPTSVAVAQFPDVASAVSAVTEVLQSPMGSHIQCVELMDNHMMEAINHSGLSNQTYATKDSLFFKFQGSSSSISETNKLVKNIVKKHGSIHFNAARNEEEAHELWNHRKVALWSSLGWLDDSETRIWTTDVCVPPSKLPELVAETKRDLEATGVKSTIVGHVGDGNFHAFLLFRNDDELEKVRGAVHRMVHRAIALDGTCTGEHGIGVGKKEYLVEELGEGTVELMRSIKKAIDPLNLFNPGKLYPEKENK
ncbi:hypothetical protein CPB86DRAFT_806917 [Serendipita vermifera]|nr:hypothetical protein CPB86DRAFT_806917 [Serendipita vermifera]